ncbi:MAG TPA: PEP-CTERM sorting domain-containing protein [Pyrinomonadaceae bacterium]
MRRTLRLFPAVLLFGWLFLPSAVLADPIVFADPFVITNGTIDRQADSPVSSNTTYNFSGPGISVVGGTFSSNSVNCNCSPPFIHAFQSTFSGGSGAVVINGLTFNLPFNGVLTATSPPVELPPATSLDDLVVTLPFVLSGNLIGCNDIPLNCADRAFEASLTGQGFVTVHFRPFTVGGLAYDIKSATYNFQPAPVPEPATLLLLGGGLAGVAASIRKRRKASS